MADIQHIVEFGGGASTQQNRRRWLIAIRETLGDESFADFVIDFLSVNWASTATNLCAFVEVWIDHHKKNKTNSRLPETNIGHCLLCQKPFIKRAFNQIYCNFRCRKRQQRKREVIATLPLHPLPEPTIRRRGRHARPIRY